MALTVETESRIYRGLRTASGAAAHLVALGFTVFVAVLARPGSSKWDGSAPLRRGPGGGSGRRAVDQSPWTSGAGAASGGDPREVWPLGSGLPEASCIPARNTLWPNSLIPAYFV